jgi:hypothetical protein
MGSVNILLIPRRRLPAGLGYTRHLALEGELAQANAAQLEVTVDGF